MENKLELRVGDVVRLLPLTITEIYDDGDLCFKEDVGLISPDLVDEIISRGEIARLEAENARLSAENAELKARLEPKPLWYPPFDDRFGPWIDGPPPLGRSHTYQTLLTEEREKQCFDDAATPYPELFQMAVAHRVFLGGF